MNNRTATVISVSSVTDDIKIIRFRCHGDFSFKAGQFINVHFDDLPVRSYSLAAPMQNDGICEIHTRIMADGTVSRFLDTHVKKDFTFEFSGPYGNNIYDDSDPRPLLAIAGGLGIAPLKTIIETALTETVRPVTLFWGTRTAQEQYISDALQDLSRKYPHFEFHSVIDAQVGDVANIKLNDVSGFRIHLSGPPAMLQNVIPILVAKGADEDDIFFDAFD